MHSVIAIFLVMAGCLANAGCVSSKPVHQYTLGAAAPHASAGNPDGVVLLVGNIATSEALQDSRIRYRDGSDESGRVRIPPLDGTARDNGPRRADRRTAELRKVSAGARVGQFHQRRLPVAR